MDTVVELLQALVRIPSVNPDNAPGTHQTGEARMVEFLSGWLTERGAAVTTEEVKPNRANLIARFAPMDGRPRVMFGPHLDTVGVGGMTIDPFGGEVREGRLWGRGACDTKGPMSAMLWAWLAEKEWLADAPVAVDFVAFMGEESGQWGSKDFARRHGSEYQFAVVGEPTSMEVVYVNKGSLWATLVAHGKAAHSSMPELGENAVMKLARGVAELERVMVPELARFTHPVLGHSTINVGVIRGGSRPNVVPDRAEAEIDIRITPSLRAAGGAEHVLRSVIARHVPQLEILSVHENPPMDTPAEHPMVQKLLAAGATGCAGAPWFSDAAHLSAGGIPSVCIGPGGIRQAHTADEFIELAQLEAAVPVFRKWITSLAW
jgi:acetylornithine deacetylase/succinyl-diaminopimelate desuccinylase-like protein